MAVEKRKMWLKILLSISVLSLLVSGLVAHFGMQLADRAVLNLEGVILNKFPAFGEFQLEPDYPVKAYLKDLYINVGVYNDVTLILLGFGLIALVIYLFIKGTFFLRKKFSNN